MTNLYIYDDGYDCFVVRKTDSTNSTSFAGEVVEVRYGETYDVGQKHTHWAVASFKPLPLQSKLPHVHAELIHAWADGAEIEYYNSYVNEWLDAERPSWDPSAQYRIKPEKKEPEFETVNFVQWFDGENLFWLKEGVKPKFPSRRVKDSSMLLEIEVKSS